uniref:Uncharacterized protein n=1 Tax=Arundo donax TaxID=35708 RepID=A0A0A9G496_ARUDO
MLFGYSDTKPLSIQQINMLPVLNVSSLSLTLTLSTNRTLSTELALSTNRTLSLSQQNNSPHRQHTNSR